MLKLLSGSPLCLLALGLMLDTGFVRARDGAGYDPAAAGYHAPDLSLAGGKRPSWRRCELLCPCSTIRAQSPRVDLALVRPLPWRLSPVQGTLDSHRGSFQPILHPFDTSRCGYSWNNKTEMLECALRSDQEYSQHLIRCQRPGFSNYVASARVAPESSCLP
jgi:hypothetical protein